jgi:hypothetical protein
MSLTIRARAKQLSEANGASFGGGDEVGGD